MENTNEIIMNEEVIDVAEEIATTSSGNSFKVAAGIGLTVLGGVIAYKYAIKPLIAKIKAKKEQQIIDDELNVVDEINEEIGEGSDETE